MHAAAQPKYLVVSNDPAVLREVAPVLSGSGASVSVVLVPEVALIEMTSSDRPDLVLLDTRLPGVDLERLLAAINPEDGTRAFPIILLARAVTEDWIEALRRGIIDDVLSAGTDAPYLLLRVEMVLRSFQRKHELEQMRAAATLHSQHDSLTGIYNRGSLLSMLFRETDRAQRMGSSLCAILLDIDDFGHWNARLGSDLCDELLIQVVERTRRMLRSYDPIGRVGSDEFMAILPGCSADDAVLLAERIRTEVFALPYRLQHTAIRLSACFAVASSRGRSPIIVLHELEDALKVAKDAGPETIQSASECPEAHSAPMAFLSPTTGEDPLVW